jgi:hypothetical protein
MYTYARETGDFYAALAKICAGNEAEGASGSIQFSRK